MTHILSIRGNVRFIIALIGTLGLLVAANLPAQAQRYSPYCAQFSDGSMDCSYPSAQSCRATISGVGGSCILNPRARNQPPPPPNFFQRLMQGNGPAFAPVDVGPPPDSGLPPAPSRRSNRAEGRYCATYSNGSTNCGFPTMQSCRAAVSGVGGMCRVNPRAAAVGSERF